MFQSPESATERLSRRNIVLIVATLCVTALVAPHIFNSFSTRDEPQDRNALALDLVSEDYGPIKSGNYVRLFGFGPPIAIPSCRQVTPQSSASYQCVNPTTVKQTTFSAVGCKPSAKNKETLIINGQNGAIVECSKKKTPFVQTAILDKSVSCPARRPPLSKIKSIERWATGACFSNFGPPGIRYGCMRNQLVTDQFASTSCTGVFYRTQRKCSSTSTQTTAYKCSRGQGNTRPPRFPRPFLLRKPTLSCGSSSTAKVLFSLNKCYGNNFPELKIPVIHSCRQRGRLHIESMFSSGDCKQAVVSEVIFPTRVCLNGQFKERCVAGPRQMRSNLARVPKKDAIVGIVYNTPRCTGRGIKIRFRKNVEFGYGFGKIKMLCKAGRVIEVFNKKLGAGFQVGKCQPLVQNNVGPKFVGKNSAGVSLGKYVRFVRCF